MGAGPREKLPAWAFHPLPERPLWDCGVENPQTQNKSHLGVFLSIKTEPGSSTTILALPKGPHIHGQLCIPLARMHCRPLALHVISRDWKATVNIAEESCPS